MLEEPDLIIIDLFQAGFSITSNNKNTEKNNTSHTTRREREREREREKERERVREREYLVGKLSTQDQIPDHMNQMNLTHVIRY